FMNYVTRRCQREDDRERERDGQPYFGGRRTRDIIQHQRSNRPALSRSPARLLVAFPGRLTLTKHVRGCQRDATGGTQSSLWPFRPFQLFWPFWAHQVAIRPAGRQMRRRRLPAAAAFPRSESDDAVENYEYRVKGIKARRGELP